jgi:GTP-binding protein
MTATGAKSEADRLAGERLFEQSWRFVKGVVGLDHLPPPARPEIAVAGRSNVGKSTFINALVKNRTLARASNTPGRTQELNFFEPADQSFFLVDLPGYGFAEAPKAKVEAWTRLIEDYLRGRPNLVRALVLIDSRHGFKAPDRAIMTLLDQAAVAFQVVLTKADKISPRALEAVEERVLAELEDHPAAFPGIVSTSAADGMGMDEARILIAEIVRAHRSGSHP